VKRLGSELNIVQDSQSTQASFTSFDWNNAMQYYEMSSNHSFPHMTVALGLGKVRVTSMKGVPKSVEEIAVPLSPY
jgi:hypothetical protein